MTIMTRKVKQRGTVRQSGVHLDDPNGAMASLLLDTQVDKMRNFDGNLAHNLPKFWLNFRQYFGGMGDWLGGMGGWLGGKTLHFFQFLARRRAPAPKIEKKCLKNVGKTFD